MSSSSVVDLYGQCAARLGSTAEASSSSDDFFRCFSDELAKQANNSSSSSSSTQTVLLALAAALVFFMQAGFAMVCAGAIRKKNVQNSMMKNLLDACGVAMSFFAIGYAFSYGGTDLSSATKTLLDTRLKIRS